MITCLFPAATIRQQFCYIALFFCAALAFSGFARAGQLAGLIPGQISVTQTGSASYVVPIAVPTGTAGVEPALSISYNSQGAGNLGPGWSLNGFSAISRCARTLSQDGDNTGVRFLNLDRYCIDGHRLIAVSGSNGQNGTEYKTEIDSYSRIKSYGRQGKGPSYFVVETKSGDTIEYGRTEDSRIEANGRQEAVSWAQNKRTDAAGNYLTTSYNEISENTEYYPTRIDYTGNEGAGLSTYNSVRFNFVDKANLDKNTFMSGGVFVRDSRMRSTKRLAGVSTWYGETKVGEYKFDFKVRDGKPSLLEKIRQCDGQNTCFSPITISWQEGEPLSGFGDFSSWATSTTAIDSKRLSVKDINNDGLNDVAWGNDIYVANGQRFVLAVEDHCKKIYCYLVDIDGNGQTNALDTATPLLTGDLNGDGKVDVYYTDLNKFVVSGTGVISDYVCGLHCRMGDANADGWSDLISAFGGSIGSQPAGGYFVHQYIKQAPRRFEWVSHCLVPRPLGWQSYKSS